MCSKMAFASRGEAKDAAREIAARCGAGRQNAYECPSCGKWHLTRQTRRDARRVARKMGRR